MAFRKYWNNISIYTFCFKRKAKKLFKHFFFSIEYPVVKKRHQVNITWVRVTGDKTAIQPLLKIWKHLYFEFLNILKVILK